MEQQRPSAPPRRRRRMLRESAPASSALRPLILLTLAAASCLPTAAVTGGSHAHSHPHNPPPPPPFPRRQASSPALHEQQQAPQQAPPFPFQRHPRGGSMGSAATLSQSPPPPPPSAHEQQHQQPPPPSFHPYGQPQHQHQHQFQQPQNPPSFYGGGPPPPPQPGYYQQPPPFQPQPPPGADDDMAMFQVPPLETAYYDRLRVAPSASAKEITRAYRQRARELHPDKHGDDPAKAQEFKAVTEAYSILAKPATRLQYHYHGPAAAAAAAAAAAQGGGADSMAATTMGGVGGGWQPQQPQQPQQQQPQPGYCGHRGEEAAARQARRLLLQKTIEQHFGDGRFAHLIGERLPAHRLVLQQQQHQQKAASAEQEQRIAAIAENLADRLGLFVAGQHHEFERLAFEEAQSLRGESMGGPLLGTLGAVYQRCARKALRRLGAAAISVSPAPSHPLSPTTYQEAAAAVAATAAAAVADNGVAGSSLPLPLPPLAASVLSPLSTHVKGQAHKLSNYLSVAASSLRLLVQLRRRSRDLTDPQVLPQLLDALWAINRVEIEGTVADACKRVLRDPSQAAATREARARGLLALGQIFTTAARLGNHPDPPAAI